MVEKLKNIIEDIAIDFLDKTLTSRIDICSCSMCKNDMLAYVLSRVPAKYVTTEKGALHTIIDQTRIEKEAEVGRAVITAMETIGAHPRHESKEDKNQTFQILLDKIYEDRGIDFRHYHHELLKRRLSIRMHLNKVSSLSDYLMILLKNPQEYDKLFEVLCINVSEFFRDPAVWDAARNILKSVIQQKVQLNAKKMVIWSAASAYGEEPYSIAIMIKELLKTGIAKNLEIEIYASDIDPKALRGCEKADYGKTVLKNVTPVYLKTYFTPQVASWKVKNEIKKMVTFKSINLISQDYINNTDVVFCRNVFIYFTRSLQDQYS